MEVLKIREAVKSGRFFNIKFRKLNGEVRRANARIGVKKNVNGKGLKYDPIKANNLIFWDTTVNNWRTAKCDLIISLTIDHTRYQGDEEE